MPNRFDPRTSAWRPAHLELPTRAPLLETLAPTDKSVEVRGKPIEYTALSPTSDKSVRSRRHAQNTAEHRDLWRLTATISSPSACGSLRADVRQVATPLRDVFGKVLRVRPHSVDER